MSKNPKSIFTNNEVIFVGLSRKPKSFSQSVYKEFRNAGIKVYGINPRKSSSKNFTLYKSVGELERVPECAYILLNKANTRKAVNDLLDSGVKRILFHNKNTVDQETINLCKKKKIEVIVACPKMLISKGLIHRLHGKLAGV